jgi:hypothetical protein
MILVTSGERILLFCKVNYVCTFNYRITESKWHRIGSGDCLLKTQDNAK